VLLTAAIAGLVAMSFYVQRAIQGGTFGVAQAVGSQYDPRDAYREDQTVSMTEEVYRQTLGVPDQPSSMVAAHHHTAGVEYGTAHDDYYDPRPLCLNGNILGCERRKRTLESLPTGFVFREPSMQLTEMTAEWNSGSTSTYRDAR